MAILSSIPGLQVHIKAEDTMQPEYNPATPPSDPHLVVKYFEDHQPGLRFSIACSIDKSIDDQGKGIGMNICVNELGWDRLVFPTVDGQTFELGLESFPLIHMNSSLVPSNVSIEGDELRDLKSVEVSFVRLEKSPIVSNTKESVVVDESIPRSCLTGRTYLLNPKFSDMSAGPATVSGDQLLAGSFLNRYEIPFAKFTFRWIPRFELIARGIIPSNSPCPQAMNEVLSSFERQLELLKKAHTAQLLDATHLRRKVASTFPALRPVLIPVPFTSTSNASRHGTVQLWATPDVYVILQELYGATASPGPAESSPTASSEDVNMTRTRIGIEDIVDLTQCD